MTVSESPPQESINTLVTRLARAFRQVHDATVRELLVIRRLAEFDNRTILEMLHRLQVRALQGDTDCNAVLAAGLNVQLMSAEIGQKRMKALLREAEDEEFAGVRALLRELKPVKLPEGDEDLFLQYGLPRMTTGERKSAARSLNRDILTRVGYDTDPNVIRQLLQNPHLTELMVLNIVARRPNRPEIIEEIYRSPKWKSRTQVRLAIIRNPYTPPQLAVSLVATLLKQELREVANDGALHPEVREAARRALEWKNQAGKRSRPEGVTEH